MEKANVVPIHKRDYKQNVINDRPFPLLPFFGEIFERFMYSEMYLFSIKNDLTSPNQSGFRQENSFINQLSSITHDIYQ